MPQRARFAVMTAAALMLTACGQQEPAGPDGAPQEDQSPEAQPSPSLAEEFGFADAPLVIEGADALMTAFTLKDGLDLEPDPAADVVVLSGEAANTGSGGRTGGVHITIDAGLEAALSGGRVEVLVLARTSADAALLGVYSTVEHPSEGWQALQLEETLSLVTFQSSVPEMERGLGDVVGFRPWQGPVEIAAVAVRPAQDSADADRP